MYICMCVLDLLLLVNKEELKSAERPLLKSIFTFMSDQITAWEATTEPYQLDGRVDESKAKWTSINNKHHEWKTYIMDLLDWKRLQIYMLV